jgi:hypothetical protein
VSSGESDQLAREIEAARMQQRDAEAQWLRHATASARVQQATMRECATRAILAELGVLEAEVAAVGTTGVRILVRGGETLAVLQRGAGKLRRWIAARLGDGVSIWPLELGRSSGDGEAGQP